MARRTMTLKRIDPWSVLKFSLLANVVFLGVVLLAGRVAWFIIERLDLVGKACEVAEALSFENCGVDGGAVFRNALLLGLLGVVVQTGIFVFLAFLHNLLAELTGGFTVTFDDPNFEPGAAAARRARPHTAAEAPSVTTQDPRPAGTTSTAGTAGTAAGTGPASTPNVPKGVTGGMTAERWGTGSPTAASDGQGRRTAEESTPSPAAPTSPAEASKGSDEVFPRRRRTGPLHGPDRP